MTTLALSIIVPVFNERENLVPLHEAITKTLDANHISVEILLVDDGSTDGSWQQIESLAHADSRVRGIQFKNNCGETAATDAGLRAARGELVMTMDADLQNDPADIPAFLAAMVSGVDCVCGTRVATRGEGDDFIRVASSRIANAVRNRLSQDTITDAGCTYRCFRRSCVPRLRLYRGLHRFIPTLLKMEGYTVTEIAVTNHPRLHGGEQVRRVEPPIQKLPRSARDPLDEEPALKLSNRKRNRRDGLIAAVSVGPSVTNIDRPSPRL